MLRSLCLCFLLFSRPVTATTTTVPFDIPFDTSAYVGGPLEALSDDKTSGAVVYWRTDETTLFLGLAANAPYVGFGMNVNGPGMPGADIVVCREVTENAVTAVDYFSERYGTPELDVMQDWATESSGRVHPPQPTAPPGACPSGWTWSGTTCFFVSQSTANWHSARDACTAQGAQLAKIASQYENQLVRSLAGGGESKLWLGGVDITTSSFSWTDSTAASYTNWQAGQPAGQSGQNCLYMGWLGNSDDKWYSADCRWTEPRYACSRAAAAGTPTVSVEEMQRINNVIPVTWCEISRARTTCEPRHDVQLQDLDLTIYGLLAWAPSSAKGLSYHGASQRRVIPFSFNEPAAPSLPTDVSSLTLTAPDHIVSTAGGSYACSYHELPIPDGATTKYHVINYKVTPGSPSSAEGVFHHMDLVACDDAVPGLSVGWTGPCESLMALCQYTLINGGYGPSGTSTPPDAGIPIGKGGTRYVVMSRHFYNPAGKSGVLDRGSTYRLTYTRTLRQNDMSQITLGTQAIVVPPNTFGHTITAHCSSQCTQRLGAATVRSVSFHMHGHGSRSQVRLVRDGVELEPLAVIDPWDQSQATRSTNRELKAGDTIFLDCVYDNAGTTQLGYGDNINDEMCWAFMVVYGQSRINSCIDLPNGLSGSPPTSCNGWTHLEACNWALPRSYCRDQQDTSAPTVFVTSSERTAAYSAWVPPTSDVSCDGATGTPVTVPAIAGQCRDGVEATGQSSCGLGSDVDFVVRWKTICQQQKVEITLDARLSGPAWFALGLHNAGTAGAKVDLTASKMTGPDIVQVSVNAGTLRDSVGVGYTTPRAKQTPVATLVSSAFEGGRAKATFSRPFASSEGLSLQEDGFVWLLCAYRRGSDDFDVKHHAAHAVSSARVSLFGGVAESTRYRAQANPTPGPTPQAGPTPAPTPPTPAPPTPPPATTVTTTTPPPFEWVSVLTMIIGGLDFNLLTSALTQALVSAVRTGLSAFFSVVDTEDILVELGAGSVAVNATVRGEQARLTEATAALTNQTIRGDLAEVVATEVKAIPGIGDARTGPITVGNLSAFMDLRLGTVSGSIPRSGVMRILLVFFLGVAWLGLPL